jgi:putative hemolysin
MAGITTEIILIVLLVIANGLFAMSEMALVASRKARLKQRAKDGDAGAKAALALAEAPSDLLATAQIGITLVGVLAGAFGGATIAEALEAWLKTFPAVASFAHGLALFIVVAAITLLSILFGELVPKRLALAHAEGIASFTARPMRLLSKLCTPIVRVLGKSTDAFVKVLGIKPGNEPAVTDDEVRHLLDQGIRAGNFEFVERAMVDNLFKLSDRRVGSILTPRQDLSWLDVSDSQDEIHRKISADNHARYIVADGDLDHVIGVVRVRDLLKKSLVGARVDLKAAVQKPVYVPETLPALKLLEMFKRKRQHMALVLDEYGGLQGIVTLGDVLESILGDIPDHGESSEPEAVQRDDGSWLLDGGMDVEKVRSLLHLPELTDDERQSFSTLAGFVMYHLGRVPAIGDHFEFEGARFEVVDLDGRRIDRVLAERKRKEG